VRADAQLVLDRAQVRALDVDRAFWRFHSQMEVQHLKDVFRALGIQRELAKQFDQSQSFSVDLLQLQRSSIKDV